MPGGADSFLPPKFSNVVEKDPRIIKNDEDFMEMAARPSALPKTIRSDFMVLKHVSGSGGK